MGGPKLIYSQEFAEKAVDPFLEKFSRGTENCRFLFGFTDEYIHQCAYRLIRMQNQMRWETFKRVVKYLDKMEVGFFVPLSPKERKKYYADVKRFCQKVSPEPEEDMQRLLDNLFIN